MRSKGVGSSVSSRSEVGGVAASSGVFSAAGRCGAVLAAGVMAIGFAACSSGDGDGKRADHDQTPPPSSSGQQDQDRHARTVYGDWKLYAIEGRPFEPTDELRAPTLRIDREGRMSGFSGVNRFSGAIDIPSLGRGEFATGAIASTKMAGSMEAMNLETSVLSSLERARQFSIAEVDPDGSPARGHQLELYNEVGRNLITFRRP